MVTTPFIMMAVSSIELVTDIGMIRVAYTGL
jgi:hypothetical protein